MKRGKVNVLIDGQWGSTGKGKLAGYLAYNNEIDLVTMAAQPQAGHTHVEPDGEKIVAYHIPISGIVGAGKPLIILNAGSTLDIKKLLGEVERFNCGDRLIIHPHAAIVSPDDKQREHSETRKIASTMQGTGAATARKIMRTAKVAKDFPELKEFVFPIQDIEASMFESLDKGETVLAESTQGFDLSLDFGQYPHCTSRTITTSSILSTACVPPTVLGDVYAVLRTFPIRVGNISNGVGGLAGHSGPCYPDQEELTWEQVIELSGSSTPIIEKTTVTKRIRRVFTFSMIQAKRFCKVCDPDFLFINFINYINAKDKGEMTQGAISQESIDWLRKLQAELWDAKRGKPFIAYLGTGARLQDMIEITGFQLPTIG